MKDSEEIREWYNEHRAPKEENRIKFAKSELEKRGFEFEHPYWVTHQDEFFSRLKVNGNKGL